MWTITKRFDFSAAHHLNGLPAEHPCSRPHGHNYSVEIDLVANQLDAQTGFVLDYRDLDAFKTWLDRQFDHRDLNDSIEQPSAELLAQICYQQAAMAFDCTRVQVAAARVKETEKTCAEFRAYADLSGIPLGR